MDPLIVVALVLGVSFLSNVSPFAGTPYTLLVTLQLQIMGLSASNYIMVVVVSAVGATLAKMVIYAGAFGFRGVLEKNKNVRLIGRNSSTGRFYLILFATALLPVLPLDDFIYIGAGASAAAVGFMASVTLLAKIVKSAFEIALELTILRDISGALNLNGLEITLALSLAFVVIGIALYKLDWEQTYRRFTGRKLGDGPQPSKSL